MNLERGLVLADMQYPQHNKKLIQPVEDLMADYKWDYLVYLGDMLDMDAISHHALSSGDRRSLEGKRLKKDYEAMATILRRHRKIVGPKCHIVSFLGNHEEWADRMVDEFPGLEGMIEPRYVLPFDELKIEVVDYRKFKKIGRIVFLHGDQEKGGYGSVHHAKKYVELYNRNLVYGDKHTLQVFTKVSPAGIDDTHSAYAIPCLADTHPKWNREKPTAWINGLATFEQSPKRFNIYPIIAVKDGFIYNGKEYE